MLGYISSSEDANQDKGTRYHCVQCGAAISSAERTLVMNGARRHSFVNPSGVRCNFYTFSDCENVLVGDDLFHEHSWFPEYAWRFLVCAACRLHLGWKYDAVRKGTRPEGFFGVLIDSVKAQSTDG